MLGIHFINKTTFLADTSTAPAGFMALALNEEAMVLSTNVQ